MKIGVFGPSSALSPELFEKAIHCARGLGHEVYSPVDPSCNYASNRYLFSSNSVESRLESLRDLIYDSSVDLIFAARGGSGAMELVPGLEILKKEIACNPLTRPVALCGFSDFTVLLSSLASVPNVRLIHGPGFVDAFTYAQTSEERLRNLDSVLMMASGQWLGYSGLNCELLSGKLCDGFAEGSLVGGNLSLMAALVGSRALKSLGSQILFIEEIGEKPHKIHRYLLQLKNAGHLDDLKGVVLGEFINCKHTKDLGPDCSEVFKSVFASYDYPVISGFPAGHGEKNLSVPLGVPLRVSLNSLIPIDLALASGILES